MTYAKEFRKQMNSDKSCFEIKLKDNIYICKEYTKIEFRIFNKIDYLSSNDLNTIYREKIHHNINQNLQFLYLALHSNKITHLIQ